MANGVSTSWAESNLFGLWKILRYGSPGERERVLAYLVAEYRGTRMEGTGTGR